MPRIFSINLEREIKHDTKKIKSMLSQNGIGMERKKGERWICLITQPGREYEIAIYCLNRNIPFFLPFLLEDNNIKPLWPAYLFCRLTPAEMPNMLDNARVKNVLIPNGDKSEVSLLDYIKKLSPINELKTDWSESKIGEEVIIRSGPLAGLKGKFGKELKDSKRVLVLLDYVSYQGKLIIEKSQLKSKGSYIEPTDISIYSDKEILKKINNKISQVNDEIIRYLARHPKLIYKISPRKFEELIASLLADMGYEIEMTPETRDGGRDILATFKIPPNIQILILVECKKFSPDRKVGVELVERFLWVVLNKDRANCGLIATTSYFTSEVERIKKDYNWILNLCDFDKLREWLSNYGKWSLKNASGLWLPENFIKTKYIKFPKR